jgi:putative membrane protein
MFKALLHFAIVVGTFLLLSHSLPGFYLRDWQTATLAALLFGIVNSTLGFVLKLLTFPLVLVTFGLFSLFVNALMLLLVSTWFGTRFSINGLWPAIVAAVALAAVNLLWKAATARSDRREDDD